MEAFAMKELGVAEYYGLKDGQMKEKQLEKEIQKKDKACGSCYITTA